MNDRQSHSSISHEEAGEISSLLLRLFALMVLTGVSGVLIFGVIYRFDPLPFLFDGSTPTETIDMLAWSSGAFGSVGAFGLWFMMKSRR